MSYHGGEFDVIVVGAGHAGVEAGLASARMGADTLMLTLNLDAVAFMPCNPSVGGPAKGIVVREIDALGGEMARNIDKTHIQMRMLNTGKGPAVRALRAQADKFTYQQEMKETIEDTENLILRQGMVEDLIVENGAVRGVITQTGAKYYAETVVITTGTYLRGKVILGELSYESGPNNMQPSVNLSYRLQEMGFEMERFKTGTPPRVNGNSIDYSKTEKQPGDDVARAFSFETTEYITDQLPCWLTYTNEETHSLINDNLQRSPMYSGMVEGTGPRYCPSIEDKIVRFHDKPRHQIFLEPEGRSTKEVYVQGLSTSLPEDVQHRILKSVPGLENVRMMRPGYAIEYDAIVPTQLWPSLETKKISGLFTAGQINGTSGYEEAAGQGIMAGINAALAAQNRDPLILDRSEAYIGVLIDDLVTKGTNEPYRLLTSRAEYRLLLRHDNADFRLLEKGYQAGLISNDRYERFKNKEKEIDAEVQRLRKAVIKPDEKVNQVMADAGTAQMKEALAADVILKRPEISYEHIAQLTPPPKTLAPEVAEQVEITVKYEGYIAKQMEQVDKLKNMENKKIPENLDYMQINGIAYEARQKLSEVRPLSVAQASRVSGVNPSDISVLLVYLEQGNLQRTSEPETETPASN
ncbi:tRNA uridine-5-carboxymethylaminomethyl(34) synthesis enzyme MnmG [Salisediminibacterium halotolerans]|uniref:tRNA uridine 5-carboxymethylaminomethyl modification enzyme MnmG n=1 Tax=Salisediminibacterium halotolerans TaxID=517425 RepID=A0A1H9WIE2_9BACI|nr:tRNA uridine-5-carboxymethylaminomethyl(34) synthesis enzyme MnmG [Salisediminibacterium haloalkalitolerans]SES33635.1 tRNA uridine 5-carboxymethylaminomethyl modification enzyme [Salisediminibacterium haloalkalitolerans]